MPTGKMHADEVAINGVLVRRLLTQQFPQWANLPLVPVSSAGTDNALYQLGNELVVRLPRISWAAGDVDKECHWLPRLAPHLPLAIPVPLAQGAPGQDYPWGWAVYRWLPGEDATRSSSIDLDQTARDLADFVAALRRIDPADGPPAARGVPLPMRDGPTRMAIATLAASRDTCDSFDPRLATAAWEAACQAPAWDGPPMWVHGDIQPLNLLVYNGRLSAVIDFGGLGVGDPACDLIVAWNLLSAETRAVFRTMLATDDATWARGRGWALSIALIALPYYHHTNPALATIAERTLAAVFADTH